MNCGNGEKFRGANFEHYQNFRGMLKDLHGGPLSRKFVYGRQAIVGRTGPFCPMPYTARYTVCSVKGLYKMCM